MKVILLQDIENIGKKFDVKEVAEGYARNFLIPRGLVKSATKKSLEWLEIQKDIQKEKAEEGLKEVQVLVSKIDGREVMISMKAGKEGKVFGSVTSLKIAESLKEMGFDVDKSQIELEGPIKEIGEWPVKISFAHGLEAEIRIIVAEEKPKGEEEEEEE